MWLRKEEGRGWGWGGLDYAFWCENFLRHIRVSSEGAIQLNLYEIKGGENISPVGTQREKRGVRCIKIPINHYDTVEPMN